SGRGGVQLDGRHEAGGSRDDPRRAPPRDRLGRRLRPRDAAGPRGSRRMKVVSRSVYLGPSLYAKFPVIRLVVDLGDLEAWPTARLGPAFVERLLLALPGLKEHGCSYAEPGGFVRRLTEDEGTWLGHVLEHVAIELQNVAGID